MWKTYRGYTTLRYTLFIFELLAVHTRVAGVLRVDVILGCKMRMKKNAIDKPLKKKDITYVFNHIH